MTKPTDDDLGDFAVGRVYELRVDEILAQLDEKDPDRARHLRNALARDDISARRIAKVVNGWGISLADGAVAKWRERRG